MQLDPVRGDAALAVDVVEEADPRDPHERRGMRRVCRKIAPQCRKTALSTKTAQSHL